MAMRSERARHFVEANLAQMFHEQTTYPVWDTNRTYILNHTIQHSGGLYTTSETHTSKADRTPPIAKFFDSGGLSRDMTNVYLKGEW